MSTLLSTRVACQHLSLTTRVNTAFNVCHVSTLQVDHGWVVNTRTKSFAVYAATRAEKQGWIEAINKVTRVATC